MIFPPSLFVCGSFFSNASPPLFISLLRQHHIFSQLSCFSFSAGLSLSLQGQSKLTQRHVVFFNFTKLRRHVRVENVPLLIEPLGELVLTAVQISRENKAGLSCQIRLKRTQRATTLFDIATEALFPPAKLNKNKKKTKKREKRKHTGLKIFRRSISTALGFAFNCFNPSVPHLASVERGTQQSALCSAPGQNLPSCTENKSAPHSLHKKKLWATLLHYWLSGFFFFQAATSLSPADLSVNFISFLLARRAT